MAHQAESVVSPLKVHGVVDPAGVLKSIPFANGWLTMESTVADLRKILVTGAPTLSAQDLVLLQSGAKLVDNDLVIHAKRQRGVPVFAFISAVSCRSQLAFWVNSARGITRVAANSRVDTLAAELQASKLIMGGRVLSGSSLFGDHVLRLACKQPNKTSYQLTALSQRQPQPQPQPTPAPAPEHQQQTCQFPRSAKVRKVPQSKSSCTSRFKGLQRASAPCVIQQSVLLDMARWSLTEKKNLLPTPPSSPA